MDEMNELEAVAEKEQQEGAESKETPNIVDETFPEEYRGKSIKDIVQLAESRKTIIGKQGNELGEVRRLADELIKSQIHKPKEQEVSREIDFFENPQEAIKRAVETNPEVQEAKKYAIQARQEQARLKLLSEHPDALSLAQSEEFNSWVNKSAVRKELLGRAHNNFDVDAANELFSTYKELKAVRNTQITDAEKSARKQAINSAEVDSGGSGEKSKKVFKRTELLEKMAHDKKWYQANKDEIAIAYAEGRVR